METNLNMDNQSKKYIHNPLVHNMQAPSVIVPLLFNLFSPRSVIDVGAGLGTWLKCFQKLGVKDILGLDGDWIDSDLLVVDKKFFKSKDLRFSFDLNRKFDLALCLEVAEHFEEEYAERFIFNLCDISDIVVFGAAIPGQGGQNHLNEKPPDFWVKLFKQNGFLLSHDLRNKFWNNNQVNWWYKQNMLVFTRKSGIENSNEIKLIYKIHPELWERELQQKHAIWRKLMDTNQGKLSWRHLAKIIYRKIINYHLKVIKD